MYAIDHQMRQMFRTPGVSGVCLLDWRSGRVLEHLGESEGATGTAAMLRAIDRGPLCVAQAVEDVMITEGDHHLLFAVMRGSRYCVQVRVEREEGDVALALRRLRHLADNTELPTQDHGRPPRRGRGGRPRVRAKSRVDRPVLERVLTGLRSLAVAGVRPAMTVT